MLIIVIEQLQPLIILKHTRTSTMMRSQDNLRDYFKCQNSSKTTREIKQKSLQTIQGRILSRRMHNKILAKILVTDVLFRKSNMSMEMVQQKLSNASLNTVPTKINQKVQLRQVKIQMHHCHLRLKQMRSVQYFLNIDLFRT